jgi:hypothetical protein
MVERRAMPSDRSGEPCDRMRGEFVNGRKIATILVVLFVVFFIVNSPKDAAAIVKSGQHILAHGFTSISEFINNL